MRVVKSEIIEQKVYEAINKAVCILPDDVVDALNKAKYFEEGIAKLTLENLLKNIDLAQQKMRPICQDTGAAVFFVQIGEDVFVEGSLKGAINRAVSRAYTDFYLRKSMVKSPIERENTGDNTPAIIHFDMVPGDKITIHFMPKGFGSENKSAICMLTPADGVEGIEKFVVETVKKAGSDPCPPNFGGGGHWGDIRTCSSFVEKSASEKSRAEAPQKVLSRA
ncbi:fumarate hydratase [Caldicellulosiruptor danielii]|uniref:fumarate hydratase n=1 Tax=Anaerocellum danielii TaxID=1387557 RepID=UPI003A5BF73A